MAWSPMPLRQSPPPEGAPAAALPVWSGALWLPRWRAAKQIPPAVLGLRWRHDVEGAKA
jgi:hypothetical protein